MVKPRVFIGSSVAAKHIAEHAAEDLRHDAEPEMWTDNQFHSTHTPIENLFRILGDFQFALFVAFPQDVTTKGSTTVHSVRDNVLVEMALFLGRLGRDRVFLIAPQNGGAQALHLPTDLTGIAPSTYDVSAANLQSQVGISLNEMKRAIRAFVQSHVLFDSSQSVSPDTLVSKGGRRHDHNGKPISDEAQAIHRLTNEALEITRVNQEGVWEIEVRPRGRANPTVAKAVDSDRRFQVCFEAKVSDVEHTVRSVSINSDNWAWIDSIGFSVTEKEWRPFRTTLRGPMNMNILVRIQDEVDRVPGGTLSVRNISVRQLYK